MLICIKFSLNITPKYKNDLRDNVVIKTIKLLKHKYTTFKQEVFFNFLIFQTADELVCL